MKQRNKTVLLSQFLVVNISVCVVFVLNYANTGSNKLIALCWILYYWIPSLLISRGWWRQLLSPYALVPVGITLVIVLDNAVRFGDGITTTTCLLLFLSEIVVVYFLFKRSSLHDE